MERGLSHFALSFKWHALTIWAKGCNGPFRVKKKEGLAFKDPPGLIRFKEAPKDSSLIFCFGKD